MFLLSALLFPALALAESPDTSPVLDHIHKTFNTPASYRMSITDLKPSPLPGLLSGTFEVSDGQQSQIQPIHISTDGRRYILSDVYPLVLDETSGLLTSAPKPGQPTPPTVQVSTGGAYVLFGPFEDASVDPDKLALSKIDLSKSVIWGKADAPLTLIEFSEIQCPFCSRAQDIIHEELLGAYKGKLRVVFKHYPLRNIHPWAYDAAIAIACVGKIKPAAHQGVIEGFFKEVRSITPQNLREKALGFAKAGGVDVKRFQECFDKKGSKDLVDADMKEGDAVGVNATPTLFVNGRRVRNYQPEELRRLFDELLPQKSKPSPKPQ
ncbi:MAG: DsbA family protein [Elusimicrobiota bacterium]